MRFDDTFTRKEREKKKAGRKNIEKSFRAFFFFYEPQQTDSKKQINMLFISQAERGG